MRPPIKLKKLREATEFKLFIHSYPHQWCYLFDALAPWYKSFFFKILICLRNKSVFLAPKLTKLEPHKDNLLSLQ